MVKFVELATFLVSLSTATSFGVQSQQSTTPSRQLANPTCFSRHCDVLPFVRGGTFQSSSSLSASSITSDTLTEENLNLLSDRGRKAIQSLVEHDKDGSQAHVYGNWPEPGTDDEGKKKLADQVCL